MYVKAGGYKRWHGFESWVLDWSEQGDKLRRSLVEKYPYLEGNTDWLVKTNTFFKHGWTYSMMAQGSLSARCLDGHTICDSVSPAAFSESPIYFVGAILNSRLTSYILRSISMGLIFREGYVARVPIIKTESQIFELCAKACVNLKKSISTYDMLERSFISTFRTTCTMSLSAKFVEPFHQKINKSVILLTNEAFLESEVFGLYSLSKEDQHKVTTETGVPAGWYPLIKNYNAIPQTDVCEISKEVIEYLNKHEHINPSQGELSQIKSRLRALYEAGLGAKIEDVIEEDETKSSDDEDELEALINKRIPIPTETFLEELSVKMEIHPISIYWLLKEMREKEGIVCWSECKRYVEDYFTVMILRMLGFRWPKQIEANEPVPEWADKDGIIPITDHTGEKTLLERIRDCIGAEFGEDKISTIEQEFSDILYNANCKDAEIKRKTHPKKKIFLGEWLEREFFRRHASQFKKRPIVWHLSSSNGTFQVLLFYHKLLGDTLKNLKNRYLSKVHQFYRVLLERARSGETISGSLTLGKLQDIEAELEDFAFKLDQVINLPYEPLIDDGVRVNIAPLQKVGLLKHPVLATKDVDLAISDRNRWREDDKEQDTVWRI